MTRTAALHLARMTGNRGIIMRQLTAICAQKDEADRINVTFSISDTHVSVTFDPTDLPNHPQRRRPVVPIKGRCLGIDLNPNWIGLAAASNTEDQGSVGKTRLLEHALVKLDMPKNASAELVRETLAAVCDRAISMARKHRCGTIVLEKGLGTLRSSGKNRTLNRLLNCWARTVFVQMLQRRARLAGIDVLEVWAGYSSTIGNLAYEAPDACASATEIARRGIVRLAGMKDVLPALEEGCVSRLWKNGKVPAELGSWQDVHRTIKAAKIGYRRPHPDVPLGARGSDVHGTHMFCGHAVVRLARRQRPGLLFRLTPARPDAAVRIFAQCGRVPSPALHTKIRIAEKASFDVSAILATAERLKYTSGVKQVISKLIEEPSEDFVRLVAGSVYEGRITAQVKKMLTGVVRTAFRDVIMVPVKNRLSSALADTEEVIEKIDEPVEEEPEVVTTEEEREGYMIVKAIVRDTISSKRVVMRDQKSYCGILIDNNNRKPLARLHFNRSVKYIGLFDGESEERLIIDSLDQIYDHSDRLRVTAKKYFAE
ncbi:hypothetical protein [Ensifer sp. ENS10]|uniref:hypothetical protein n=1 Tax=Ensifer sp. ENS10 TaxID=2769286 RepID=UPI001FEFC999|nr:hypothetical protein [Ensifer sp. ENS10]